MPERDTPQGTAPPTPAPADVENTILDAALFGDPDEEQDTPEQQPPREPPSKVSEDDDDDSVAEDEGDADEEDVDQPRDAKGRFVSKDAVVKADDGEEVTIEELLKGRLRQSDYSRKTMELAEQRKAVEAERNRAEQTLQQFKQAADFTLQAMHAQLPPEPDQALLDRNSDKWDPIRYQEQEAAYKRATDRINQVWQQRQAAEQEQLRLHQEQTKERLKSEEARLYEVLPELKDPKIAKELGSKLMRFGTEKLGFSREEIQATTDHRVIHALTLATRFLELESQKGKTTEAVKGKPPLVQGRRQDPKAVQGRKVGKAWETLQSTGGRGADGKAAADLLLDQFIK